MEIDKGKVLPLNEVPRYFLFTGPMVEGDEDEATLAAAGDCSIGFSAYAACARSPQVLLDIVKSTLDQENEWWQVVDILTRTILYGTYVDACIH